MSKQEVFAHVEKLEKPSLDVGATEAQIAPFVDIDDGFDPVLVRRTMRKVDWRLIPILIAMYTISLIDRTNLSTARAANEVKMDREIGTGGGQRYTIITLTFFIPVRRASCASGVACAHPSTSSSRSPRRSACATLACATGSPPPSSSGASS